MTSDPLRTSAASDQLVVFGDGMEDDRLTASWDMKLACNRVPVRFGCSNRPRSTVRSLRAVLAIGSTAEHWR